MGQVKIFEVEIGDLKQQIWKGNQEYIMKIIITNIVFLLIVITNINNAICQDSLTVESIHFTIDTKSPVVSVISPNGGEYYEGTADIPVIWESNDDSMVDNSVSIYVSVFANEFQLLDTGLAGSDTAMVEMPFDQTTQGRVRVSASDAFGNVGADESDGYFVFSRIGIPPMAPENLIADVRGDSILLSWQSNIEQDLWYYLVYRDTSGVLSQTEPYATVLQPVTVFIDTSIDYSFRYYYSVTAVDSMGNESEYSNIVSGGLNRAPTWASIPDMIINEDESLHFSFWAVDEDLDSLSYEFFSDTSDVYIDFFDSLVTIIASENWNGRTSIIVNISDAEVTLFDTFLVDIVAINDPPEDFELIYPEDGTIIENTDSASQNFRWGQAFDIDSDEVIYSLLLSSEEWDSAISNIDTNELLLNIEALPKGMEIMWFVTASDSILETSSLDTNSIQIHPGVNVDLSSSLPRSYTLEQNFPNPFNPSTTIRYSIPDLSVVNLTIYDVLGREVKVLVDGIAQKAGSYEINWESVDTSGDFIGNGLYFGVLQTDNFRSVVKMVYIN